MNGVSDVDGGLASRASGAAAAGFEPGEVGHGYRAGFAAGRALQANAFIVCNGGFGCCCDGIGEFDATGVAVCGFFGESLEDCLGEPNGEGWAPGGEWRRRFRCVENKDFGFGLVFERPAAAEQFVDGDGEGVLVDAAVEGLAHDEFGGHVFGGAQDHAGTGHRRMGGGGGRGRSEDLGDAEIAEEGVSEGVEEDIAGFDVAVDVTLGVDVVESLSDGSEPAGYGSGVAREGLAVGCGRALILETSPGQELHDGEGNSVEGADIGDLDDVGVGEADEGADFAGEAAGEFGVVHHGLARDLDDDLGVDVLVEGAVDEAHAAFAELGAHEVASTGEGQSRPLLGSDRHEPVLQAPINPEPRNGLKPRCLRVFNRARPSSGGVNSRTQFEDNDGP